jgi:hypothetical protein
VLIGGAVWSVVGLLRRRGDRRLVISNSLIAAGTIVLSAAGLLNSVVGEMEAFSIAHVIGISFVFGGFLAATPGRRPLRVVAALRETG